MGLFGTVREQAAPVRVRAAVIGDADIVAKLAGALSLADGGRPSRFTAEAFRQDGFRQEPAFRVLLAEVAGEAVGYALYYPGYDSDRASRGVYLADLYVAPDARRKGAGRTLMKAVAQECSEAGGCWMFWSVLKRNRAGRRFYRTMAPELKDIVLCAAFGDSFDRLAGDKE